MDTESLIKAAWRSLSVAARAELLYTLPIGLGPLLIELYAEQSDISAVFRAASILSCLRFALDSEGKLSSDKFLLNYDCACRR
ncbi:MAG: hypothetical protein HZA80_02835 [Candidatus Taylorbacteria bacterium]|nr:hypothetical protein [Candidatus Taylorbacteria bacterium]